MQTIDNCLSPTPREQIAQGVANLRMGLPCILNHASDRVVVVSVETLVEDRFDALLSRFAPPELVITTRRAQAVMSPAAAASIPTSPVRILPPENATLLWYKELADPQYDTFGVPSGPLHLIRQIDNQSQQLAIKLVKTAELLPAALVFSIPTQDTAVDLSAGALDVSVALDVCGSQPNFSETCAIVAPDFRRSILTSWACLLFSRGGLMASVSGSSAPASVFCGRGFSSPASPMPKASIPASVMIRAIGVAPSG